MGAVKAVTRAGGPLAPLFFPGSVAVIGASRQSGKIGNAVLLNLMAGGYQGRILPINPGVDEVEGLTAWPDIGEAVADAGLVDLAVIAIPAPHVAGIVEECGRAGVKAAIVISAGFREAGREGWRHERQLVEAAHRHHVRLLGPNCLGLICSESKLNATFARTMPLAGNVALMSQSGALCTSILDWSIGEEIGFARFVSLGNKVDVDEVDLLKDWRRDGRVDVVAAYLEQVGDGAAFLKEARLLARKKPLIILKAGVTDAGARASSSHTGSLAGSEKAYRAAVTQTNALPASSMAALFDLISMTSLQPLPGKGGVAIITNAGGPGILAADACEREELRLASLSARTISRLARSMPAAASLYNPVDILGDADGERYRRALEIVASDRDVASVIVILTPQAVTDISGTADAVGALAAASPKPVAAAFIGGQDIRAGIRVLRRRGVPNFDFPERAVTALARLHSYVERRRREKIEKPERFAVDRRRVSTAFEFSRGGGYLHIGGFQALDVLKAYGLNIPKGGLARSPAEAAAIAGRTGFPVVLKAVSPNILHKTDVGGIRVGIDSPAATRDAFEDIRSAVRQNMPDALFMGVAVQEMITGGREVIIGSSRDPQFGPLLMFGLGGIHVEVMEDVTFRIAPITRRDARQMMTGIRSFPLLAGVRGEGPADSDAIVEALLRCSQLVTDFPDILEMDLNPLLVRPRGEGAWVADARMVIAP